MANNNLSFLRKRLKSLKEDYLNARFDYLDFYEYYLVKLVKNPTRDTSFDEARITELFNIYTKKFLAYQNFYRNIYIYLRNSNEGNLW